MNLKRWLLAATTVVVVLAGASAVGGAAPPAPTPTADDDAPLTGETRDRAASAAVTHVGGGEVTETEVGDNGAGYGVEVRRPDGTQVEVNLDETYAVTQAEPDDDGPGDDDATPTTSTTPTGRTIRTTTRANLPPTPTTTRGRVWNANASATTDSPRGTDSALN